MDAVDDRVREGALAALAAASSDAMIAWSADGRVLVWSGASSRLYGYSAEEAVGRQAADFLTPADRCRWPQGSPASPVSLEMIRVHKDGTLVPVRLQLQPIYSEDGRVVGLAEAGRLQTDARLVSEDGSEAMRLHLSSIVESSEDAIISKSLTGVIQSWNRGAQQIFGYQAEEVVGRPITILIPPDRQDEEVQILARIRAGERVQHFETVRVRKDGRAIQVSLTVSPVFGQGGRIMGASKIARDVTAMRRAQRELSDTQERLQAVVQAAAVVLFAFDGKGCLTFLEGRALSALGLKSEALLGCCFLGITTGGAARFSEYLACALRGERCVMTLGMGGRFMEIRWFPVRDVRQEVVGASGVAVDITEQRRAQEDAFRTSKWDSMSALAGGIAHDFNNMLAAIVGNLALARMKLPGGSEVTAFIEESEKAALQARGLTQQLLSFAKGGSVVKRPVDIGTLVESTVRFALGGANVRAHVLLARDLWKVLGDEGQLAQVMNNLTINAQQAMPQGGVVEVLARNVSLHGHENALPPGDYVQIDCVDQGAGIETYDLTRVFEPFFTTKPQGTGLGLTTSSRIVGEHGGLIQMESARGQGTRARLYLPRFIEQRTDEAPPGPPRVTKARVLFMDDEEPIRKVAQAMLGYLGYDVCVARDGAAALSEYQRGHFDVVILDLTVRDGLGGLATLERLRSIDPGVVAIVSSGYSSDPVMADHERYGFVAKVPKPYTPEALDAAIAPLVGGRPGSLGRRSQA